jgi:hypothetical protein
MLSHVFLSSRIGRPNVAPNWPPEWYPAYSMWFRKRQSDAIALFVIAGCVTVAFWKIALTNQYTFIESPDIGHQVLPWLQVQAAALHKGIHACWAASR